MTSKKLATRSFRKLINCLEYVHNENLSTSRKEKLRVWSLELQHYIDPKGKQRLKVISQ